MSPDCKKKEKCYWYQEYLETKKAVQELVKLAFKRRGTKDDKDDKEK